MDVPPPPMALPPVPHLPPIIHDVAENRSIQVLGDDGIETTELAFLFWDSPNVTQAYQLVPRPGQRLNGGGKLLWANILLREKRMDGRVVFRRSEMTAVIKRLDRQVIDPPLQGQPQGGEHVNENPFAEISVLQQHGNGQHILQCHEALWDEHFLYIVTLKARDGDLFDHIRWGLGGGYAPQNEVPRVAKQLLRNLEYLQQNHLVHRALKPEHVLVTPPWVPFIGCAMTVQIPFIEGRPQKIVSQGAAGSPYYISPKVFSGDPFDHKVDVWAFGNILFNLLTGLRLCELPCAFDECYTFFIIQRGLENEDLDAQRLDVLSQNRGEESCLSILIQAVQMMDQVARNLLQQVLSPDPQNRPEVDEIVNHPFFHGVA